MRPKEHSENSLLLPYISCFSKNKDDIGKLVNFNPEKWEEEMTDRTKR
jgi:hypothetical protein